MLFEFPSKKIEEEDAKISELFLASDEDITLDEFVEKYGSDEYKQYYKEVNNIEIDMTEKGLVMA